MTLAGLGNHLRHRKRLVLIAGVILSLAVSSLAVAEEGDQEPGDEEETSTIEPMLYLPDGETIVFSLPDADGEFSTDCSEALTPTDLDTLDGLEPTDEGTEEGEDGTDGDGLDDYSTFVDGCYATSALGPNGQSNHGQAVRAVVHALKNMDLESLGYEGPRGHIVRYVAKSDFGKDGDADGPENGDFEELEDPESGSEGGGSHPGRGKAKGKNK